MRIGLAIWLALIASVELAQGSVLLVLTEPTARGLAGQVFDQWIAQLRWEGWSVSVRELPRWTGSYVTNDWPTLRKMSNEVARANPDAVQIIGRLPPIMTGGANPDGHEVRRCLTYQWLGCTNLTFTDTIDWTNMVGTVEGLASVIATNRPGDGIPDQVYGTFARPVCVLDASGLVSSSGTFSSGFLTGTNYQLDIEEGLWIRRYLTNNLQYRTGIWTVGETGHIDTASWLNYATVTATNNSVTFVADTASVAGSSNRWDYNNFQLSLFCPSYVTAGGVWAQNFWVNAYKSYGQEDAGGRGTYRRVLFPGFLDRPIALVSSWSQGANSAQFFWMGRQADNTVAEAMRSACVRFGGVVPFEMPIAGDVTLPFDNAQIVRAPGTATVTLLSVQ